jgi:hypothetical protein
MMLPITRTNLSQQAPMHYPPTQVQAFNDNYAKQVAALFASAFPGTAILPGIGLPSQGGGVMTLTHGFNMPMLKIDGLVSKSPLSNNALYSAEIATSQDGSTKKWLNLYEAMMPDIPGVNGGPSLVQRYVNALHDCGLDVAGVHVHWTGAWSMPNDKGVWAIHHQAIGMDPMTFAKCTIEAIQQVLGKN